MECFYYIEDAADKNNPDWIEVANQSVSLNDFITYTILSGGEYANLIMTDLDVLWIYGSTPSEMQLVWHRARLQRGVTGVNWAMASNRFTLFTFRGGTTIYPKDIKICHYQVGVLSSSDWLYNMSFPMKVYGKSKYFFFGKGRTLYNSGNHQIVLIGSQSYSFLSCYGIQKDNSYKAFSDPFDRYIWFFIITVVLIFTVIRALIASPT
ncbi:hypothetical protein Fcan01_28303 [Folsomia candida]|uniref:Uncharacterized protein n=1 Tax=Folsomia candida TaxID=158441 RepID=A0A226CWN1_FOLCA|nr:hypothetical protein Fcan01_28303 [Folsomia candida]